MNENNIQIVFHQTEYCAVLGYNFHERHMTRVNIRYQYYTILAVSIPSKHLRNLASAALEGMHHLNLNNNKYQRHQSLNGIGNMHQHFYSRTHVCNQMCIRLSVAPIFMF